MKTNAEVIEEYTEAWEDLILAAGLTFDRPLTRKDRRILRDRADVLVEREAEMKRRGLPTIE